MEGHCLFDGQDFGPLAPCQGGGKGPPPLGAKGKWGKGGKATAHEEEEQEESQASPGISVDEEKAEGLRKLVDKLEAEVGQQEKDASDRVKVIKAAVRAVLPPCPALLG